MENLIYLDVNGYIGIIGAILLLLIGYILLHKFVLIGRKNRRLQNALAHKYNYAHNLLLNEDSQHLRRIEAISDINLLMKPIYEEFYRRFEQLRDIDDRRASRALQVLNEELVKGNKDYKSAYQENRFIVVEYENKVLQLNKDLANVIRPETEIREMSIDDKKTYRIIKSIYRENKKELELVDASFEKIFTQVDKLFIEHEEALNGAYYDDARAVLEKIRASLKYLEKALESLPLLCVKTSELIPQKLEFVRKRYFELEKQGIPLPHLLVNQQLDKYANYLEEAKHKLRLFNTQGIDRELTEIDRAVSEILTQFDEEVKKRDIFLAEFDPIYGRVNDIEKRFIKLVNNMGTVKKIYQISEDADTALETLKVKINDLSNTKRMLDSFIHSSTRQPYSVLVEKMYQLKDEADIAEGLLNTFFDDVEKLKTDAENAHVLIKKLYFDLKKCEAKLRDVRVESFVNKYVGEFDRAYELIDLITITLQKTPIDVTLTNTYVDELTTLADTLIQKIDIEFNNANLAEASIVYLNRYRTQYSDVQAKLSDEEIRFMNGSFSDVYDNCTDTIKQFRNK